MIDEYFERKVDEWCERVPRALKPHLIRFANSGVGWRIYLYADGAWNSLAKALGHIRTEEDMDLFMREAAERSDDGIARLMQLVCGRSALISRMNRRFARGRFTFVLFLLLMSVLGVCAHGGRLMGFMALSLGFLWLSVSVEVGYQPVCGKIRQRHLVSTVLRMASSLALLPGFFISYLSQGVPSNVVLQSAMVLLLATHGLIFIVLILLNTRQPLLLRALSGIAGIVPALTAAAALSLALSLIARPWPLPLYGALAAAGALMVFLAEELTAMIQLGGIRLKYPHFFVNLFVIGGFALMLAGGWNGIL